MKLEVVNKDNVDGGIQGVKMPFYNAFVSFADTHRCLGITVALRVSVCVRHT